MFKQTIYFNQSYKSRIQLFRFKAATIHHGESKR